MRAPRESWQAKPRSPAHRWFAVAVSLAGTVWAASPALAQSARDQTVVAGEYFINTDPGEGVAAAISTTYGSATADAELHLTLAVNDVVYVRFRSSNGRWGAPRSIKNTVPLPNRGAALVAAEFFVTTDPGVGNGTPASIGASGRIELPPVAGLARNASVFVRVRDSFGRWSAATGEKYRYKNLRAAQYRLHLKDGSWTQWAGLPAPAPLGTQPGFFRTTSPPLPGYSNVAEWQVRFQSEDYLWGSEQVAPQKPQGLTATAASSSQIDLTWQDNSSTELGFEVQRRPGSSSTWAHLATLPAGTTSYSDTGLPSQTLFVYRVRSFAQGQSDWSNDAPATTPPSPPTAEFTWSPGVPVVAQLVQFTDTSTGVPTSWSWDFGDGTGSTQRSPSHGYATAGGKTVRLTASNGSGSNIVEETVTIICAQPGLTLQPQSQTVNAGQTAALTVAAIGTAPLSYQWYLGAAGNTSSPVGTNSTSFTTPALFTTTSYWVRAANACGNAPSNTATIAVPSNRVAHVLSSSGAAGGTVSVPVELMAQGDENSLRFSLTFDPVVLTSPEAFLGSGAGGATITTDSSQVPSGRLGVTVALPPGQTFSAGARRVVVVDFAIGAGTSAAATNIGLADQPVSRGVLGTSGGLLPTTWTDGSVNISRGYLRGTVLVPLLNHNTGLYGSVWRGDLELWNQGTEAVSGTLYLTERNVSLNLGTDPRIAISLQPGETQLLVDAYGQMKPGVNGVGAFRLVMDTDPGTDQPFPAPLARGRFYNVSGAGMEFGMSEPGLDPQGYLGVGTRLGAVMEKEGNRNGIFIVSGSAGAKIHWKHTDTSGAVLFDSTISYGRDQTRQYGNGVSDILRYDPAPGTTLEATIVAGTARVFLLYINNQTNDPSLQEMRPLGSP